MNGEDLFVENIPQQLDFDTNGTVRTANSIGLSRVILKIIVTMILTNLRVVLLMILLALLEDLNYLY